MRHLGDAAVDAALGAGASYADARSSSARADGRDEERPGRRRSATSESEGIGVRVLVDGAWGFACDRAPHARGRPRRGAARDARSRRPRPAPTARSLAPVERARGGVPDAARARSVRRLARGQDRSLPARRSGAAHDDVIVTLRLRARAARAQGVRLVSDGSAIEQELVETGGGIDAIATARRRRSSSAATRARTAARAAGRLGARRGPRTSSARRRGSASRRARSRARTSARPRTTTVVLDAEQMMLAGARVGRAPDRARPRLRHRGGLRGHELPVARRPRQPAVRLGADERHRRRDDAAAASAPSASTTRASRPRASRSSSEGVLRGFLTSRETAARLGPGEGGSMRADGWSRMPLVRMTNLHLEPGEAARSRT